MKANFKINLVAASATALCLSFFAPAASAALPFRVACPAGSFVVGFAGRAGAWIDRIAPVCAKWNGVNGGLGPQVVQNSVGESHGGNLHSSTCQPDLVVGGEFHIAFAQNPNVLHSLEITCVPVMGGATAAPRSFGSRSRKNTPETSGLQGRRSSLPETW